MWNLLEVSRPWRGGGGLPVRRGPCPVFVGGDQPGPVTSLSPPSMEAEKGPSAEIK